MNHPQQAAKFVANDERMHWHDKALWFVREKEIWLQKVFLNGKNCVHMPVQLKHIP